MTTQEPNALYCTLSMGGFSDERVFRIKLDDGETHIGACSRRYCYTRQLRPVGRTEPERGKQMEGLVAARLLRELEDAQLLFSVPDGEVVVVDRAQATHVQETSPDVSFQS